MVMCLASSLCASGDGGPTEFWLDSRRTGTAAAGQVIGAADPWMAAALRLQAFDLDLWHEPPTTLDRVPPLNPRLLAAVRDDRPFAYDEHKLPEELTSQERDEDTLYWQAIRYAAKVPVDVFAQATRANGYLSYGHLYTEPAKYRGQAVHFSGRLGSLKKLDPPVAVQARGINAIYEAWVFLDQPSTHPLCVIVPHAPVGVGLGEGQNIRVEVDGYFIKRYHYISGRLDANGNNMGLRTVMLIAPTLTVKPDSRPAWTTSSGGSLFAWIIGFGIGVAAFMALMMWWFRRSDRLVRERLEAARARRALEQAAEMEKALKTD